VLHNPDYKDSVEGEILWFLSIFITHTVGRLLSTTAFMNLPQMNNDSLNPSDEKDISSGLHDDHPSATHWKRGNARGSPIK
jgi:hypothetical protein